MNKLLETYPWLAVSNSVEEYLAPSYYKKLLKEYSFNNTPDIEYLESYLKKFNPFKILELGCGSGRATAIVLNKFNSADFTLVDLSEQMMSFSRERFSKDNITFEICDALNFLKDTKDEYDFVYSLWSFSHSTHQHIHRLGFDNASILIKDTLTKFIRTNLKKGSKFFLIHFDSMSEEQSILMQQWKRIFPAFAETNQQSPSKRILDAVLWDLDNRDEIVLSVDHLRGDKITYTSEDEVLEIFLNFHMETYFNNNPIVSSVIDDIKAAIIPYRQKDATYSIQPGCYIYSFEKR